MSDGLKNDLDLLGNLKCNQNTQIGKHKTVEVLYTDSGGGLVCPFDTVFGGSHHV